jgi:hypothetical protein
MNIRDFLPKNFRTLPPADQQAARVAAYAAMQARKAERKIELAAEREERAKVEMTCQVCARGIMANTGLLAHHGYQRPGTGWQTASCRGAKELPFQVSRDALGAEIADATAYAALRREQARAARAEESAITIKYSVLMDVGGRQQFVDRVCTNVTRARWDHIKEHNPEVFKDKHGPYDPQRCRYAEFTFDIALDYFARTIERDVAQTEDYVTRQQARFDAWVQTHERRDGAWIAVGA